MRKWLVIYAIFMLLPTMNLNSAIAQVSYHISEIPLEKTNWEKTIDIPKFDPSLGTLTEIRFTLKSSIRGLLMIESIDNSPSTVVSRISANITLKRPDGSVILTHSPNEEKQNRFLAFDGSIDYEGDSGATYVIENTSTGSFVLSPLSNEDRKLFSGEGTLHIPVIAEATSSFSGGGNLDTESSLSASTYTSVSYIYASPDITASITASKPLVVGKRGQLVIAVRNIGNGSTLGPVTLSTTIPGGLPIISTLSDKWECKHNSQSINCSYGELIPPQSPAPNITVLFNVTDAAFPAITTSLTLHTDADSDSENGNNTVDAQFAVSAPQDELSGHRKSEKNGGANASAVKSGNSTKDSGEPNLGRTDVSRGIPKAEFSAVAISSEEQTANIGNIDSQGCSIPSEIMSPHKMDNNLSCFEFSPDRKIIFTDIENNTEKRFIEMLRKTRIKSSGDYVFSGDGNPSSKDHADSHHEYKFPFSPDRTSSRFELVKIALISNCIPISASIPKTSTLFTDITNKSNPNNPHEDFVSRVFYTAAKHGIVKGYPDGTAKPYKTVNNAEILALLLRASNEIPSSIVLAQSNKWYAPYMAFAKDNHIVPQNMDPDGSMNRAELSKLLVAIMSINPNLAISSYVSRINITTQSLTPQDIYYQPSPSMASINPQSGVGCKQKPPKINACLGYDDKRRITFTDITDNSFANEQINMLARTKTMPYGEFILSGSGNHDTKSMEGSFPFFPDAGATRLAIAKTALLANCIPIQNDLSEATLLFKDLPPKRYPDDSAKDLTTRIMYTAANHGIITGYSDGSAQPYKKANTLEALAILLRSSNAIPENYEPSDISYGNLPSGKWFSSYVSFAEGNGILARSVPFSGPYDNLRRSELAALIADIMAYSGNIRVRTYITSVWTLLK